MTLKESTLSPLSSLRDSNLFKNWVNRKKSKKSQKERRKKVSIFELTFDLSAIVQPRSDVAWRVSSSSPEVVF